MGFSADALDWYREKWATEEDFSYVEMHFFRDKIRQAVDNGDIEIDSQLGQGTTIILTLPEG